MSTTYLIEIGTEELPAGFLETIDFELETRMKEALSAHRLGFESIEICLTPRRIAVFVHGLADTQESFEETLKGPPVHVALDDAGNPTKAGEGFAKKVGAGVDDLQRETIDGTEYLVYHNKVTGQAAETVLPDMIPEVFLGLSASRFMVWDDSNIRFSRPIRWVLSLLGDAPLSVTLGSLASGTTTFGHRFLADPVEISIPSVSEYKTLLKDKGHVLVDTEERQRAIEDNLSKKAAAVKGQVPENRELLKTVANLIEAPALIVGNFNSDFLSLPKEVITTVMASHQKYFPVEDANQALLPHFITVSNNTRTEAAETIRLGNEKVLQARLDDANFFYKEDTKYPLSHYSEALTGITFQKGLGSVSDKVRRLESLVEKIGPLVQASDNDVKQALRAASLCKADLATQMVRELTELQGIVGRHYAEKCGEDHAVALAIEEHYLPRFMGDAVATSVPGITLSLADKLDTLVAVFSQQNARYPTGSKDPMGLRRMTMGIIQTVLENQRPINLEDCLGKAFENLDDLAQESKADTLERTQQFVLQRLKGYLLDQQYSYDTIDAVLDCGISPLANLLDTQERLKQLKQLQQDPDALKVIYEPANRTARILGESYEAAADASAIDEALLETEDEKKLAALLVRLDSTVCSSDTAIEQFSQWAPTVNGFFDNVMVNADDAAVKANRYALLSRLNTLYQAFANFTKLVV